MEDKSNKKNNNKLFYILIILCLILIIFIRQQFYNKFKTELSLKEQQIEKLNSTLSDTTQQLSNYKSKCSQYEKQIKFMDSSVVICPADGTSIYHNYNCTHYDKSVAFLVFNPENARGQGYNPCYYCSDLDSTSDKKVEIVYVTDTGSKYHRSGCSYLKSSNPITKEKAIQQGYSACSRCKP